MKTIGCGLVALFFIAAFGTAGADATHTTLTTIRVRGTVILQPLFAAAAKKYMAAHPNVAIDAKGTSSGRGMASIKAGTTDIAGADIQLDEPDLTVTPMALAGVAFIVGPGTGATNLTQAQVVKIFSGKITNWDQVGGKNLPIVIMERAVGGGTRFIFEQTVAKTTIPVQNYPNPDKMAAICNKTPGCLSYVASYFVNVAHSTSISYNGVAPTDANIANGTYTFVGHETAYSAKPASAQQADFLHFVLSDTGDYPAAGLIPPRH
jgi:phosphate transport system substrate-binding protein